MQTLLCGQKKIYIFGRIYPDDEFWVEDKTSRVKLFFENSILPELLGKVF